MTRFGVMKHLKQLEEAGLVVTRRQGREKLHFLNPVPIRLVHDRWVSKYAEPWAAALSDLKTRDWRTRWKRCSRSTSARRPSASGRRSPIPRSGQVQLRRRRRRPTGRPGSRFEMSHPAARRPARRGRDPRGRPAAPARADACVALWGDDVKREGTSRVTWEIEPVGDSCRLTRHARPAARGRQRPALRRLADDPLRPQDVARDRRAAHDAGLADVHLIRLHHTVPHRVRPRR